MSKELNYSINATLANGTLGFNLNPGSIYIDQAAQAYHNPTVIVSTTGEQDIAVGAVVTPGYLFLRSVVTAPSTTYVRYGPKSAGSMVPVGKILAGEVHVIRMATGATIRCRAYGASCRIVAWILDT